MRNSAITCACLLAIFEGIGITFQRVFAQQPAVFSLQYRLIGSQPNTLRLHLHKPPGYNSPHFNIISAVCCRVIYFKCTVFKHCLGSEEEKIARCENRVSKFSIVILT
jgi:hypothetical protein